jgi:pimeloyl-ACP methyl ester carboxylesterase
MTIVLVHGNPEVSLIWDDLIAALDRDDVIALSPPGFGAPVPAGFRSTAPEYADWLVAELERIDGPIHLIGHDWGGGHVIGAAMRRPDLLASVTTDIAGCFADGYVWHDMAQVWRTPGAGEDAVAAMAAIALSDRVAMYTSLGMNPAAAAACAAAVGEMGPHILALYRSADEPWFVDLSATFRAAVGDLPTHVIIATDDHYTGGVDMATTTANAWGATIHRLDDLGHWWMMQDPAAAADVVRAIVG